VKVEKLDPIIKLSTESQGETLHFRVQKTLPSIQIVSNTKDRGNLICNTWSNNPS